MRHVGLVVAQIFGSRVEAELAKSRLEGENIRAMVQADTAGGMREHLAWSGSGFRVLVREEDEVAAREVLSPGEPGNEGEAGPEKRSAAEELIKGRQKAR